MLKLVTHLQLISQVNEFIHGILAKCVLYAIIDFFRNQFSV
jgi:hypothetical protein